MINFVKICYNLDVMKQKITSFFNAYIFLLALVFILGFLMISAKSIDAKNNKASRENNQIIIKFKGSDRLSIIKITDDYNFDKTLEELNNRDDVDYAEPNFIYEASIIPSDKYYGRQWYLEKIQAVKTWDQVREADDFVIAIIDSGVQISHPDLKDNIWQNSKEIPDNKIDDDNNGFIDDINGWDFVNSVSDPAPKFKEGFTDAGILHGTIVAGVAAASGNNATGVTGVTWRAKIMPLKVLGDAGEGNTGDVVKAIDYAIKNGAEVINLSFVGFGFSKSLEAAIKRAYEAGVIVVAAAGNEQEMGNGYSLDETPMYPACHDGSDGVNRVIGVAASDTIDQKASFSSYGFKCVDITAPGISIFSTSVYSPEHQYKGISFDQYYNGYWSGTSMATPMVSGAIALIEEANPRLNKVNVINVLLETADNINKLNPNYLNQLGSGRLNIYNATTKAKEIFSDKSSKLIISPNSNYRSLIKITDEKGYLDQEFTAYSNDFHGGVNISSGDVDGDGIQEVITGAGFGGGPHVMIFNEQGALKGQFFAYAKGFRGGVNVAVCDIDNDGIDEIVAGAGFGGGPHIRIFDNNGNVRGQFFAYNSNFRGGVNVACGDINNDNEVEIVAGAGKTGGPQVRIFNIKGEVKGQFFAYDSRFRGGVKVALGDIDGGARKSGKEIITAPGPGGGPHIRIFDNNGNVRGQFFAFNDNFRGGVNLAAGDIDNDGVDEILAGAGPGGSPHVRVFEYDKTILGSFFAYEENFSGGVNVNIIYK